MAEKGLCGTCGSEESLRGDGTVRNHLELLMGTEGEKRGNQCTGAGEPPELAEQRVEVAPGVA